MTIENYLAEVGALATLAGLLAGFGVSAVIQFLVTENKNKLVTASIFTFSTSTVMFLYSLIVSILLFAAAAELGRVPTEKEGLATWAFLVMVGAIFVFLAGIGLIGWVRSRIAGIITTTFAIITMCLTASALWSVLSLFA